jgi:hypothetical protein
MCELCDARLNDVDLSYHLSDAHFSVVLSRYLSPGKKSFLKKD